MAIGKTLCKDGTYDIRDTENDGRQDMPCRRNGGVEINPSKSSAPLTSKLFGAYNKNLILAVLLVAGYFAYKKFKK